jgi:hypothetical protein
MLVEKTNLMLPKARYEEVEKGFEPIGIWRVEVMARILDLDKYESLIELWFTSVAQCASRG